MRKHNRIAQTRTLTVAKTGFATATGDSGQCPKWGAGSTGQKRRFGYVGGISA